MNIFFVYDDGRLVTPELTGTILEGVTRSSILELAKELGHDVEERRIGIEEWRAGVADGSLREVFACGTAAVVTPVGRLKWDGGELVMGDGGTGAVTSADPRARCSTSSTATPPDTARLDAPARLRRSLVPSRSHDPAGHGPDREPRVSR